MKKPRYLGTPKRKIATPVLTCISLDFTWNRKKILVRALIYDTLTLVLPQNLIPTDTVAYQFNSVTQSCLTPCDPMDCSLQSFPVLHQPPKLAQTHIHRVVDAIQPSHPLSSPSPPAFNLSQHQGLFQWVGSGHQVAKVLELELQHQSFQWIFRTDFL